jgi:hypothetical protein
MMSDRLVEFLRHRKEHASTPNIDWQAKKDRWVRSVQELYGFIEEMLREPIKSKDVTVNRFDMEVTEDYIGCYTIPALALTVGNERVEFRPKGVTVTGVGGRVDVRGDRDTITLFKDSAEPGNVWKVILQRVPKLRTVTLDAESLKHVLERVMLPLR